LATIIIALGALPQQILAATDAGVVLINQSNVPYKIKSSRSYKLSSNLFPASKATAITVTTSNVTIDLNGFSIIGGVEGIDAHNQPLIAILDGEVTNTTGTYAIITGHSSRIEHVILLSNKGTGIYCTDGCIVSDCIANNNGGNGIFVDGRGVISSNVAQYNSFDAIFAGNNDALVKDNSVNNNGGIGIDCCCSGLAALTDNVLNNNKYNTGDCIFLGNNLCGGSTCDNSN